MANLLQFGQLKANGSVGIWEMVIAELCGAWRAWETLSAG
jgi:hypothetical protein